MSLSWGLDLSEEEEEEEDYDGEEDEATVGDAETAVLSRYGNTFTTSYTYETNQLERNPTGGTKFSRKCNSKVSMDEATMYDGDTTVASGFDRTYATSFTQGTTQYERSRSKVSADNSGTPTIVSGNVAGAQDKIKKARKQIKVKNGSEEESVSTGFDEEVDNLILPSASTGRMDVECAFCCWSCKFSTH